MGKIFKSKKLTTFSEALIAVVGLAMILGAVYFFAPGLRVQDSVTSAGLTIDGNSVDNVKTSAKLDLPSTSLSSKVESQPKIRIAGYAWNGWSGVTAANGGPETTKGSLMEQNNVNLSLVRQDWVKELMNMQMKFVEELNGGKAVPTSDKAALGVIIMGDGAPYYISTMNQALDEKFGKDKYHVQVVGAVGLSYGEDKLIGPLNWKTDPKSMKGALISAVLGDGDWVIAVNYAFANGLKVNPDNTTYDPEAVNFVASENDDYTKSAEELIKSQSAGWSVPLKEVKDGKLTGKTINKKVDGCATWTPGDKMVFDKLSGFTDIVSTREFNNQMPTTLIVVKEFADKNPNIISGILKATYTATNQMKQYDEWRKFASETTAKTFNLETPEYWYNMFKGQTGSKGGISYNMGGTRVFNYQDAMQYYGITDGVNRYKAVYTQVSNYLTTLNPFDFNANVKNVTPYEQAVNLYFLKNINDVESGQAYKADYSKSASTVMASGEWNINFDTGSSNIKSSSSADVEKIYNLLIQAEDSKLEVVGHTDNTGNSTANQSLSESRANAVVAELQRRGIPANRFQTVSGKGDSQPLADNTTAEGKAKNRRVVITFLK
jgi:outer membrane protein OmpA-like peptidoglycan-associated protein